MFQYAFQVRPVVYDLLMRFMIIGAIETNSVSSKTDSVEPGPLSRDLSGYWIQLMSEINTSWLWFLLLHILDS